MPVDEDNKITADDLPTIFQIAIAQETNARSIESLHTLFTKQQIQIEELEQVLKVQHEIIKDIVNELS
jgi:hypothetical protein|tara:strand:- start:94 stop:297 length:204 start_codon:yes stop_codon:yes gene_type:complete